MSIKLREYIYIVRPRPVSGLWTNLDDISYWTRSGRIWTNWTHLDVPGRILDASKKFWTTLDEFWTILGKKKILDDNKIFGTMRDVIWTHSGRDFIFFIFIRQI